MTASRTEREVLPGIFLSRPSTASLAVDIHEGWGEEEEVLPGVYVVRGKTATSGTPASSAFAPSSASAPTSLTVATKTAALKAASLPRDLDFLHQEKGRLENALRHLRETCEILSNEPLPHDKDVKEALAENPEVIVKYERKVYEIQQLIDEVMVVSRGCTRPDSLIREVVQQAPASGGSENNGEDGLYL